MRRAPPAFCGNVDDLDSARRRSRTTTFAKRRSSALIDLKRPEAVAVAIDALTRTDYQLILTAARALEDKAHGGRRPPRRS